jgi:hypothetical protein
MKSESALSFLGSLPGAHVFHVEFSASTRVISAQERVTLIVN